MLRVWTFQRTHKVHKNLSYFIRTRYYRIIHLSNFSFPRFKIVCSCWLVWINFHAIKFHHENAFSVLIKWPRLFIVQSNLAVDYANDRYRVIHISIYYLGRGILRKTFFFILYNTPSTNPTRVQIPIVIHHYKVYIVTKFRDFVGRGNKLWHFCSIDSLVALRYVCRNVIDCH